MVDRTRIAGRRVGSAARLSIRLAVSAVAFLALRWHLPLVAAAVRGEGAIDATAAVFIISFALAMFGLPGFLAALWCRPDARAWWVRAGLLTTLISSLATMLWIGVSVREIGSTLRPALILGYLAPPFVTAASAILLRWDVARVTSR